MKQVYTSVQKIAKEKSEIEKYNKYIIRIRDEEVWLFDCSSGK